MSLVSRLSFGLWYFSRLYQKTIRQWLLWPKPSKRMCCFHTLMIMREGRCRYLLHFSQWGGGTKLLSLLQVLGPTDKTETESFNAELVWWNLSMRPAKSNPGLFCPVVTFLMPCFQSPLLLERRLFNKVRAAVHCGYRKGGEMRHALFVLLESVYLLHFLLY